MQGELAALTAALLWAIASILFAGVGRHIQAIHLNLVKGVLSCLMILVVLGIGSLLPLQSFNLASLTAISPHGLVLLAISGIIGIGAGDTAYFACLRRVGPQNGLMLESTAPIIAALLALLLFQEILGNIAWSGILLTTIGVIMVVRWSQSAYGYAPNLSGILLGLLAAFCQATGIVLSRQALLDSQVEPLASALVRLFSALCIIVVWLALRRLFSARKTVYQSVGETVNLLVEKQLIVRVTMAIFLGTFLGIYLMQVSVKYTSAGITQTLLATSPLFGILLARMRGQGQRPLVWLGLLLGIVGIGLLFLY